MDRQSAAAVGAAAEEHRLGDLISVHRGERPLIRVRARWGWLLGGGLLAGLGLIAVSGTGKDFGGYALGIIGVHLLIVVVIGPVAARLFPPAGPPRAVALCEHGLIDVVGSRVARMVRFDQVRHVEQQRGYEYSDGRMFRASAAVARLTAEIDGRTVAHEYVGYRRQDRFIDEIRARRAGAPRRAASTAARRKGGVTYGGLVIGKRGMSVVAGVDGLQPAERPDPSSPTPPRSRPW